MHVDIMDLTDAYFNKMLFNTDVYMSVLVELNLNTTEIDSIKILCWPLVQCCQTESCLLWIH